MRTLIVSALIVLTSASASATTLSDLNNTLMQLMTEQQITNIYLKRIDNKEFCIKLKEDLKHWQNRNKKKDYLDESDELECLENQEEAEEDWANECR